MSTVYIYVHDLRSSGVVRNAIDFAERLARDYPTMLVAGYESGFFCDQVRDRAFGLVPLAQRPGPLPRLTAALRLIRWLRGRPPGVILSVGNMGHATPWLAGLVARHVARVYCISSAIQRDDGLLSLLRRWWMRLVVRDASAIVLVGEGMAQLPPFARAFAAGRAREVPNGVDLAQARARALAPCPHPWLAQPIPVVLSIGRLRPQKNFDLLIAGVGRARGTQRLRLVIIGGGARQEAARLTALASAAGLGEDFLLAGETDNVFAWLARARCYAMTSRWEGSSLALLEAMAVGTPVVASRLAGDAAQVLDEGRYGRLFDGHDIDALAAALLSQVGAEAIRPGDRAQAYSSEATANGHARLIHEILTAPAGTHTLGPLPRDGTPRSARRAPAAGNEVEPGPPQIAGGLKFPKL